MKYQTEQEDFWSGEFGNQYIDRNKGADVVASNTALFARVMRSTEKVKSVLELGANVGMNLLALKSLFPECRQTAVEINSNAAQQLKLQLPEATVAVESILDFQSDKQWDMTFSKGVLIHINPEKLPIVYDTLYRYSSRYILVAEYYNPSPVTVAYRGHNEKLFKRDFAGEMLDRFDDLRLLDYGFAYHRDPLFPQDDITWFLMEKQAGHVSHD